MDIEVACDAGGGFAGLVALDGFVDVGGTELGLVMRSNRTLICAPNYFGHQTNDRTAWGSHSHLQTN